MKLYNLFEEVILEDNGYVDGSNQAVNFGNIDAAIDQKYMVEISYDDGNGNITTGRFIEPVARGTTKSGNPVIRAYQLYGKSKSNRSSAWKFFRIDRIRSWKPFTKVTAKEPADGFNPYGDETMGTVNKIAKF
jgi:predicted DNA-binding transcriptional regulator YafY